jgi:hypothetical protein
VRSACGLAALAAAAVGACAEPAAAAPVDVHVRVEGRTTTLFDRVVRTDGRAVRAASDTVDHRCDGTNNGAHPEPGPTLTAATVDAMASIGEDFDGDWHPGFDDYFITRWGPDAENGAEGWWWGVLLNRQLTATGGCQTRVAGGDEVLWAYDAFSGRPFLWLEGPAEMTVGVPATVTVTAGPGTAPADGAPYAGARVEAVGVDGRAAPEGTAATVTSDGDGHAAVTFQRPGWQRLKARGELVGGHPVAIASNSIDVCVRGTDGSGCDGPPPSRIPVDPHAPGTPEDPEPDPDADPDPRPDPGAGRDPEKPGTGAPSGGSPAAPDASPSGFAASSAPAGAAAGARVRLIAPRVVAAARRQGRVTVRWSVLDAGAGIGAWRIVAQEPGRSGARVAARGTTATSARLRLPAGRVWRLRLEVTDALGRTSAAMAGTVLVPVDDSARALRYRGAWRRVRSASAWRGTLTRGRSGAWASFRLAAGRPVLVLRGGSSPARVEVVTERRREVFRIAAGGSERRLTAARRTRAGTVRVRVLRGTVSLDGVAVAR